MGCVYNKVMSIEQVLLFALVSMTTWLTPSPQHSQGLLVAYGNQLLVEANADYRDIDLSPYWNRCGISAISPRDLAKIVWVKADDKWLGPCIFIDAGARHHFYNLVYVNHEIAEIPFWMADMMGFENGEWGEIFIGLCPPTDDSLAVEYQPFLKFDDSGYLLWREWPRQQMPVQCSDWGADVTYEGAQ